MREYELTVVYDLAVAEAGGQDASVAHLTNLVETRGGQVLKVDHWGRRRLAYPIGRALDGDYVISRVNLEPAAVSALEASLKIDERVYRHLVVRADELPPPPPPREPRQQPAAEAAAPVAEAPVSPESPAETASEAPATEEATQEAATAATEVVESAAATAAEPAGEPEAWEDAAPGAETSD
ncbi:MAG: 30S ribosomal protein S6 [Dehalococcoidia bacterium]|nr:30S ribosomal protein S6 [Dehalococcoidia bacterium]